MHQKRRIDSQNYVVNSVPPMLVIGDIVSKDELDFTIEVTSREVDEIVVSSLVNIDLEKTSFDQSGEKATKKKIFSFLKNVEQESHVEILVSPNEIVSDNKIAVNSLSNIKIGGKWIK